MSEKNISDWRGTVKQVTVKPGLIIEYVTEPSQALLDMRAAGPDTSARDALVAEIDALDCSGSVKQFLKKERGLL
jgi:hypothetical protein